MKSGIYKLSWPNGYFYIGQAADLEKRWKSHKHRAKHDKKNNHGFKLYNVWNKHGDPRFEIISYLPIEFLTQAEQNLINEHWGNKLFCNTNPLADTSRGCKRSKPPWNKGRKCTPEEINKMSEIRIGTQTGEKSGNAVLSDAQVIEARLKYIPFVYPATRLAKEYGISRCSMLRMLKGLTYPHLPLPNKEKNKELINSARKIDYLGYRMTLHAWALRFALNPETLTQRMKKTNNNIEKSFDIIDHRTDKKIYHRTLKWRTWSAIR